MLILGGTGFIGPHTIAALRRGGHQITLFNNDKESAKKFPELESLFGDRDGKIEALSGRDWDVVIDNSGYVTRHVKLTADALERSRRALHLHFQHLGLCGSLETRH